MSSKRRALLTDTERDILSGEKGVKDNYRYSIESRVRTRIREPFVPDLRCLAEHQPEMFSELLAKVEAVRGEYDIEPAGHEAGE